MTFRPYGEPQGDKRLRQMILVSAVLHLAVIIGIIASPSFSRSPQPRAVAFTVDLVNPAALGTNLPGGRKGGSRSEQEVTASSKPPTSPPDLPSEAKSKSLIAKKEEPKPLPIPVQQKETVKTPEKEKAVAQPLVKVEPEKIEEEKKSAPKKTEPKSEPPKIAKVEELKPEAKKVEAKPESEKPIQKKEEKKPEPQPTEDKSQKVEGKLEKATVNSQKPEVKSETKESNPLKAETKSELAKPPVKAAEKVAEEKTAEMNAPAVEDRNRQIAAALARVKAHVQAMENIARENPEFSEEAKGNGPITKGGATGEGGGGAVRGLEFILYTQQLQRRVQESWIVTEKKPGLVASVSFHIQSDGNVQDLDLTKSSGDNAFDQSVLRAVRKAAPFPSPPQSYVQEFATQKIVMNFGGEGRVN